MLMKLAIITVLALSCLTGFAQNPSPGQCALPPSIKVHSFQAVSLESLERIIPVMEAHLNSHGFIVSYAGRRSSLAEAQRRADLAKRTLLAKREWINGSDGLNSRLNTLVCGFREAAEFELWVTPVAAAPPVCTPTIEPPTRRPKQPARRTR